MLQRTLYVIKKPVGRGHDGLHAGIHDLGYDSSLMSGMSDGGRSGMHCALWVVGCQNPGRSARGRVIPQMCRSKNLAVHQERLFTCCCGTHDTTMVVATSARSKNENNHNHFNYSFIVLKHIQ